MTDLGSATQSTASGDRAAFPGGSSAVDAWLVTGSGSGVAGSPESNGRSQLESLSTSTSNALASKESGTARKAPAGPRTKTQKTSERNVSDTERPTASPTNFGWMTDWM